MARKNNDLADSFVTEEADGWLTGLVADEEDLDRRGRWRLAVWAAGSVSAVVIAFLAAQTATERRHEQSAAADLARQAQLIQRLAKDSHSETSRLAAAIDTLNSDRDRMFSRLGSIEQGLESVTGSIARVQGSPATEADKPMLEKAAVRPLAAPVESAPVESRPAEAKPEATVQPAPPVDRLASTVSPHAVEIAPPAPTARATPAGPPPGPATAVQAVPPLIAPVVPPLPVAREIGEARKSKPRETANGAIAPGVPLMPPKSILAPPDTAASMLMDAPALAAAEEDEAAAAHTADGVPVPVRRIEFGVDLGGANSVDGLRTLWVRLSKRRELTGLHPIITVKDEGRGGTRLRLVAGPFNDAGAAARLCAALGIADRTCDTPVYEGQRLPEGTPAATRLRKRVPKPPNTSEETAPASPSPAPPQQSSLGSLFGMR
jgi:hypothetical protein